MNGTICTWENYRGKLVEDIEWETRGFAFKASAQQSSANTFEVADDGACFAFLLGGDASLKTVDVDWKLGPMQWFSTAQGFKIELGENASVAVWQKLGFKGLNAMGGPIEATGRLRYIDGCTDTILSGPPRRGDPCLNLLHFPAHVQQTEHIHPSCRMGIVARGSGVCESDKGSTELRPGTVFFIPGHARHRFVTRESELDVIAYHPDSDWGPLDENHPMINRTWIGHAETIASS